MKSWTCNEVYGMKNQFPVKMKGVSMGKKKYGTGYKKSKPDSRDYSVGSLSLSNNLPVAFSLRDRCPWVSDQGSVPDCVSEAALMALAYEDVLSGKQPRHYARKFLHWYSRRAMSRAHTLVNGGVRPTDAFKVLQKIGVPLESIWPFESKTTERPKWSTLVEGYSRHGGFYYRATGIDDIRRSIWNNGRGRVVTAAIKANSSFQNLKPGEVWNGQPVNEHDHYIAIIGYGRYKGQDCFEFQNSWGRNYGDHGFGLMTEECMGRANDPFVVDGWRD
jgi:hypothetical protein